MTYDDWICERCGRIVDCDEYALLLPEVRTEDGVVVIASPSQCPDCDGDLEVLTADAARYMLFDAVQHAARATETGYQLSMTPALENALRAMECLGHIR